MVGTRLFAKHNGFAIEVDGELCVPSVNELIDRCIFFYKRKERWLSFEWWLFNVDCATDEDVEKIKNFAKSYFDNKESE